MIDKKTQTNMISINEFCNRCNSRAKELHAASLQLKNDSLNMIRIDTPLFKSVMQEMNK